MTATTRNQLVSSVDVRCSSAHVSCLCRVLALQHASQTAAAAAAADGDDDDDDDGGDGSGCNDEAMEQVGFLVAAATTLPQNRHLHTPKRVQYYQHNTTVNSE